MLSDDLARLAQLLEAAARGARPIGAAEADTLAAWARVMQGRAMRLERATPQPGEVAPLDTTDAPCALRRQEAADAVILELRRQAMSAAARAARRL